MPPRRRWLGDGRNWMSELGEDLVGEDERCSESGRVVVGDVSESDGVSVVEDVEDVDLKPCRLVADGCLDDEVVEDGVVSKSR